MDPINWSLVIGERGSLGSFFHKSGGKERGQTDIRMRHCNISVHVWLFVETGI